jgi:hypothetical protein
MKDYLFYVLIKRNVTPYTIFREACEQHFGCITEHVDVALRHWARTGEIPYYVQVYLEKMRDQATI